MSTQVVNPTNSKVLVSMPYTSPGKLTALAKISAGGDRFNTGADYKDELPLLTGSTPPRIPFSGRFVPGVVPPPTAEEMEELKHPDEQAQGEMKYQENAVVVDMDAKLITSTTEEMKQGIFKESHFPTLEHWMKSPESRRFRESRVTMQAVTEIAKKSFFDQEGKGIVLDPRQAAMFQSVDKRIQSRLRESGKKLVKTLREQGFLDNTIGDPFAADISPLGSGFENSGFDAFDNGRPHDFIPLLAGPYNKQLYWSDYLDMHSKAYQAWTHNPIAKRIVKTICQFVLGKGVKISVITADLPTGRKQQTKGPDGKPQTQFEVLDYREQCQELLDSHWTRNGMNLRSKMVLRDLIIFGEQFPRYFKVEQGLKVRQIDPSTVWEVVADPDDCESEFYLHQQYPTRYQWYVSLPIPTIKYIIRQVPSNLYYHMKINTVAGEMRGRSELFAILGWLKRLKEFATDRVIRNKVANLFCLDIAVEGGDAEVAQAQQQFSSPPTPGSMYIHNKASEINSIAAEIGAGEVVADWEMLLTIIACGAGVSQEYLGLPIAGTKAGALIGTEPDIKTFEDYQELMEAFFLQDAQRAFDRARELRQIPAGLIIKVEVTYPAIAEENRSEKLKDVAFCESMSWISHKRSSEMASKELRISTYDYEDEQQQITQEDVEAQLRINATYAQITKGEDSGGTAGGSGSGGSSASSSPNGMGATGSGQKGGSPGSATGQSGGDVGESTSGKRTHWRNDPRAVAESIFKEAEDIRLKRRPTKLSRRKYAQTSPDKRRDANSLDRNDIVTKGRRATHGGYNEAREVQQGSHPEHSALPERPASKRTRASLQKPSHHAKETIGDKSIAKGWTGQNLQDPKGPSGNDTIAFGGEGQFKDYPPHKTSKSRMPMTPGSNQPHTAKR